MTIDSQIVESDIDAELDADQSNSLSGRMSVGLGDLLAGLRLWHLWTMLGWNDIRQRYRRSTLGPFWITISMAIFVTLLGAIYSHIFRQDIQTYLPYVAMGLITWGFISGTTIEACGTFVEGTGIIKQIRLPLSLFPLRLIWRSFIIFLHTVVLVVPIAIFLHIDINFSNFLVIPGLALLVVNQIWVVIVVSVISTRYRDIIQLVTTAIQIAMFATPIMWPVSALGEGSRYIANVNPLYHLMELVRGPLLGQAPALLSWLVVLGLCIFGYLLAIYLLWRANRRLVYWL